MRIGYVSECDKDYAKELKSTQTLEDLKLFVTKWRLVANDAYRAVHNKNFNWEEFCEGRAKENLVWSCKKCNNEKDARSMEGYRRFLFDRTGKHVVFWGER